MAGPVLDLAQRAGLQPVAAFAAGDSWLTAPRIGLVPSTRGWD
ncbi:hypothetical protein AB0M79_23670 [Polymorphospora sp. NPDC051019]